MSDRSVETTKQQSNQAFWTRCAKREALRFNFGWWLQAFLPWIAGAGIVAGGLVTVLRFTARPDAALLLAVVGLVVALGACVSLWATRRQRISVAEAMVKLEASLGLHNALTAAAADVGPWPEPRAGACLPIRWNAQRLWSAPLLGFVALAAGLLLPLPESAERARTVANEPSSWAMLEDVLDALEPEEVVQPESLDSFRQALEELRGRPREDWFSHESLEAGDHLLGSAESGVNELRQNLEQTLAAFEAGRQLGEGLLATHAPVLDEMLQSALQQLANGSLPLNAEMLSSIENLDLSSVRQLTPEQWEEMKDRLQKGIAACPGGFKEGGGNSSELMALLMAGGGPEGGGAAPLMLSDSPTDLGTDHIEILSNDDLSHAAAGDLLGLGTTDHTIDPDDFSPSAAGGSITIGPGGGSVASQPATPEEQRVLAEFFR